MEFLNLFFGLLFISGVVLDASSNIPKDLILTSYENWKGKRYIRIKNHESLKSLIEGFWRLFNFFRVDMCRAKKINHRGRGGHDELLFSLGPLCSLWFFQNPFQKITKSLGFCSDCKLLKCCTAPFVNIGGDLIETSHEIQGLTAKNEKDFESGVSYLIRKICRKFIVASPPSGTVAFSSEIAMPLDSIAECAEPRRELKTISKLCILHGDRSLDLQTVSHHHNCRIRMMRQGVISKGLSIVSLEILRGRRTGFDALSGL